MSDEGGSLFDRIKKRLGGGSASRAAGIQPVEERAFARGFSNFHKSDHWNLWTTSDYLQGHSKDITNELQIFPELFVRQIETDFGYSIFPPRSNCYDGKRLDLVLDPGSQGGAHTGSTFGSFGVSISPDAVYNDYSGEIGFWYRLLALHETINVWTGCLASGWIWADGSELWKGKSPFPNMADFVILEELGYKRTSRSQRERMIDDPTVRLFYDIQRKFGWKAYQGLFSLVRQNRITDWHAFGEPLRTGITVLFLSRASGENLLQNFQRAGIAVTDEAYSRAESIFPA